MQRMLDFATGLAEQYLTEGNTAAHRMREGLKRDLAELPTAILTEYLSRPAVGQSLFTTAKELEQAAYLAASIGPESLSTTTQSLIGVLLDYWRIDRTNFFRFDGGSSETAELGDGLSTEFK